MVALLVCASAVRAQTAPAPPCAGLPAAVYPDVDTPSIEKFWRPADVARDWQPPACLGWSNPGFTSIVTTAARFRYTGSADDLLRRIGAISELVGVRYWSPSHNAWGTLIVQARALDGPKAPSARGDFSADELKQGAPVYFEQADNLLGKAVFRLSVTEATADRIVFLTENVSAMRYLILTLFSPREAQSTHFLIRESPGVWRYYGVVRTGPHTSGIVTAHPSSSVNRAVAFFRHYAGIPTDQEPPGAR